MSASDDARQAAFEMGGTCARVLAAVMPDGRTIAQHLDDGAVALFNAMGHDWQYTAAVVRDMFPTDALEAAAAKVQEADR